MHLSKTGDGKTNDINRPNNTKSCATENTLIQTSLLANEKTERDTGYINLQTTTKLIAERASTLSAIII